MGRVVTRIYVFNDLVDSRLILFLSQLVSQINRISQTADTDGHVCT